MKNLIIDGVPTLGTCAGLILLSKDILEGTVSLGLLDCIVERNAYGRQNESFEGLVDFNNNSQMYCFIRAPKIISTGKNVENIVKSKIKNYYSPSDEVLRTADDENWVLTPIGYKGIVGKVSSKYSQILVKPKNHRFASYASTLKSFP